MCCTGLVQLDLTSLAPALLRVTDQDLRELAGERSFTRGHAFAQQGRVTGWRVQPPLTLSATVRGATGTYRSDVQLAPDGGVLGGGCTCPVGLDCKHVVAVVLGGRGLARRLGPDDAAGSRRGRLELVRQAPAAPQWEQVLGAVLSTADQAPGCAPLGLLLEVRVDGRREVPAGAGSGDRGLPVAPTVRLRPVTTGKTGWVRTGVSWSGLEYPRYGSPRLDPAQVAALRRLLQARGASSRYYTEPDWLDLATLEEGWMGLLRRCRRAGITLLASQRDGGEVVLAEAPTAVAFDLVRTDDGLVLTPGLSLPTDLQSRAAGGSGWMLVGSPPTGVVARAGKDVLLAGFEPALDQASGQLLQHGPLHVPAVQAERFLVEAVPSLAKRFAIASADGSVTIDEPSPPRLRLTVRHEPGLRLVLGWEFSYAVGTGTATIPADGSGHAGVRAAVRDAAAEAALVESVVAAGPPAGAVLEVLGQPPRLAVSTVLAGFAVVEFLDRTLPRLAALDGLDVVVQGEPVEYVEAAEPPQVHVALAESAEGHDWFDLSVQVRVGAEQVPTGLLVTALTLGEQHLVLPSGTWFRVDRPELEDLRRLLEEARALQEVPDGPLRLSPYQADLWAELEALGVVHQQAEQWSRLVKGLTGGVTAALPPPAGLQAELRPYQQEGFEWLTFLRRHGLGGVLADDMGLGKTLQVLAMMLQERHETIADGGQRLPWLVVAPTSVLGAWVGEATRFAPGLRVRVLGETTARRGVEVSELAAEADLVLTSYAVLRLDADAFRAVRWAGLVLDEAQQVKNHQSVTYQSVRRLDAGSRFAVSGTPMENNLMELWSLLSITAPGLFPNPRRFTEYYRRPIESGTQPERLATLRRRIRPVMLRRTKQQVAAELPAKQEQVLRVDLPPRHRKIYDRALARERQRVLGLLEDAPRNRIAIFRSLTVLRQLSLHPGLVDAADDGVTCAKIDTLLEQLLPVVTEGHQAIVFSQFTSFLTRVRRRLEETGTRYAYLDGRTRKRTEAVEAFRSGDAPVFLVSLKAGGTGLTLTEADYVFLLDPWWNPAVEAQAVDRAHRIGQDKPVNVYRLVSADTIEEKVLALQERKRQLFATVVDDGALTSGALSAEDIRALVH